MSKRCPKCNAVLDDTARFCNRCGCSLYRATGEETMLLGEDEEETSFLNPEPEQFRQRTSGYDGFGYAPPPQTVQSPVHAGRMSEKQFYERYMSKKVKVWTNVLAVIAFITAASCSVNLVLGNLFSLIDIAFYAAMGVLLLITKKWVFPLAIVAYCVVALVLNLVLIGTVDGGIVALIIGIFATVRLKKINDAYKKYQQTGILPQKPVG